MRGMKKDSAARQMIGPEYDAIPKSVFAAVAYHLALRLTGEENEAEAKRILGTEWQALHSCGIVPQKPKCL